MESYRRNGQAVMNKHTTFPVGRLLSATLLLAVSVPAAGAQDKAQQPANVNMSLHLGGGMRAVAIHTPLDRPAAAAAESATLQTTATSQVSSWPYPRVPIDGFSPRVAISVTDYKASNDESYAHLVRTEYSGTALNQPAETNYVIGIFDSGSVVDLIGYCDSEILGVTGSYLSDYPTLLGGACGASEAPVSMPIGIFANGLGAIQADGQLDVTQLVGHGNVAAVVGPYEVCGSGPVLPTVIGNDFVGFFTTSIRVDQPRRVTVGDQTYASPEVLILPQGSPSAPVYPRKIAMTASGYGGLVTTSSFYPDILVNPLGPNQPWLPTVLSSGDGAIPFGGAFFGQMGVLHGTPSPTNPLQTMRFMIDTGAQTCIMTPAMTANLSLPATPDFTVDVQGIGGLCTMNGYYIDYVRINALGGALEFSHVPFVEIDISSPDGGEIGGILGMNLFWNRNVVFDPSLTGSGFLRISDPVLNNFDFDRDTDVDADDLATFLGCTSGPAIPQATIECLMTDADGDGDVDQDDFGVFQRCLSGPGVPADPSCGL